MTRRRGTAPLLSALLLALATPGCFGAFGPEFNELKGEPLEAQGCAGPGVTFHLESLDADHVIATILNHANDSLWPIHIGFSSGNETVWLSPQGHMTSIAPGQTVWRTYHVAAGETLSEPDGKRIALDYRRDEGRFVLECTFRSS